VLRQSTDDWELIVADNSDDDQTRILIEACDDPRVHYFRSGGLSMPDNWEFAISHSTGDYLCLLEDKQALHFDAFERLAQVIERERPQVVRWEWDEITPDGFGHRIRSFGGSGKITTRPPAAALAALVDGSYFSAKSLLPIPHYSAISAELLEQIRNGPVGRLCPPVTPDYTLALQVLNYCDKVTYLDASLVAFTDLSVSNGVSIQMKSSLGKAFIKEIGDTSVFQSHVPVKVRTIGGLIYNDYMVMREKLGGRLAELPPNWANYYFGCYESIQWSVERGVDMADEEREWERALACEPVELQRDVRSRLSQNTRRRQSLGRRIRKSRAMQTVTRSARSILHGRILRSPLWRYDNILDYLSWRSGRARD
jgi:glycosyltransferase involved in cell wall biosynthesis